MDTLQTGIERLTGGSFEPTADALPKQLSGQGVLTKKKLTSLTPEKPKKDFAAPFIQDPAYSEETMPTYIPKFNTPQARAQGGFVGEYNYAQPQQATMGTPFPNAVDSNPQQSQSFLQPNDAKKNSRVELANGSARKVLEAMKESRDQQITSSTPEAPPKNSFVPLEPTPEPTPKPTDNSFVDVPLPQEISVLPSDSNIIKANDPIERMHTEGKIQSYLSNTIPNTAVTGDIAALIIAGEVNRNASDAERQRIIDTIVNRGNYSELAYHKTTVQDTKKIPIGGQYHTLRDHVVRQNNEGKDELVNRTTGVVVANAEDLQQAREFVLNSNTLEKGYKPENEATHFITREKFEENQKNPDYEIIDKKTGKKRNLGTGSFGGKLSRHEEAFTPIPVSPDSRHLFFKENIVQKKATGGFINP